MITFTKLGLDRSQPRENLVSQPGTETGNKRALRRMQVGSVSRRYPSFGRFITLQYKSRGLSCG
jgi:hypothetical protein